MSPDTVSQPPPIVASEGPGFSGEQPSLFLEKTAFNGLGHVDSNGLKDPVPRPPKSATLPPALDTAPTSQYMGSLSTHGREHGHTAFPSPYSQPSPSLSPTGEPLGPSRRSSHLRLDGQPAASSSRRSAPVSAKTPFPHDQRRLLSHHLIAHPEHTVKKAAQIVFPRPNALKRLARRFQIRHSVINGLSKKEEMHWEAEADTLRKKAGWKMKGESGEGVEVSPLFWKMYMSIMPTLQRDPLSGLVPPDLIGSTSTVPLTIISLIPDIMQHYRDVIVRAEKEIFLATNYWQPSNSSATISQALKDLSASVLKRGGPKVVVKIMYDRGTLEQIYNAHAPVLEEGWAPLKMPAKKEIEGLDLEVINFHRLLVGTFHAKFIIVDRKVALINSNNIQDRPNLELMSHLEGPIVDSFYEVALQSWWNKLDPPLPCMKEPYVPPRDPEKDEYRYLFQEHNPYFDDIEILKAAKAARLLLRKQTREQQRETQGRERLRDAVWKVVDEQRQHFAEWKPGDALDARAQTAIKELREFREKLGMRMEEMGQDVRTRMGSRANSRAPSRRASQNENLLKAIHFADKDTAKATAFNASINADQPVSRSVGPSPRSKTMPLPAADNSLSEGTTAHEDGEATPRKSLEGRHAHFAAVEAGLSKESPKAEHEVVDSPYDRVVSPSSTSFSGRSPALNPRMMDADALVDSPAASSLRLPLTDGSPPYRQPGEPIDATGEALPATARMPNEQSGINGADGASATQSADSAARQVRAIIAGDGGISPGEPRPAVSERKDSEIQPPGTGSKRAFKLSKKFNAAGVLSEAWATVEDSDDLDNFRPHVVHAPHDPVPIAMCCRKPHGMPGHHDIRNPQNAAWLAGFRYAQKKVFIQSPTLNARPIVRAIKQACRRGVEVVLLLDLGFNDKGESIPFQGGTNEEVVDRLYKKLGKEGKVQYLKVYWYTGKDQVRPLNAVVKQRNCHIKFAAYDDEVLIIGNGNQDSQSWFHSQEVNVMIDSKEQLIAEMMDTLLGNQNTMKYGRVSDDGVWRDKDGKTLKDYGAIDTSAFRGLSAFWRYATGGM